MEVQDFVNQFIAFSELPPCRNLDDLCERADLLDKLSKEFGGFSKEDQKQILAMIPENQGEVSASA